MAGITVKLDQKKLNRLIKDMKRYTREVGDRVDDEMTATAEDIATDAKANIRRNRSVISSNLQNQTVVFHNKRFDKLVGPRLVKYAARVE